MQGNHKNERKGLPFLVSARRRMLVVLGAAILAMAAVPTASSAGTLQFEKLEAGAFNEDGSDATQAGSHPWALDSNFEFNTVEDPKVNNLVVPAASLRTTTFELPAGVLGNVQALPQCPQEQFNVPLGHCPPASQVGVAKIDLAFVLGRQFRETPIYNLVPPPGQPAQLGFLVVAAAAHIDLEVRKNTAGDYAVLATVRNANMAAPVYGTHVELWGVPYDESHNAERYTTPEQKGDANGLPFGIPGPHKPFLRNPTSCGGALRTNASVTSWQQGEGSPSFGSAQSPPITGCSHVPFSPAIESRPDGRSAAASAGMAVDINLPQNENVTGVATSDLKKAVVTLPAGVAINASSADGLLGCSDPQFAADDEAIDQCPSASKIGELEIQTPLLKQPLTGSAFLGTPLAQNEAARANGQMYRLFLEAEGSGVRIKLAGSVVPDPKTGQLTATFDDNPQLPFEKLHLQLNGGERAPLSLPTTCGTYTTVAELFPWARPTEPVTVHSNFTISENCAQAGKFEPSVEAGSVNPAAGKYSPFIWRVTEPAGQQNIARLKAILPTGVLAKLAGVPLCPDAQAASGNCPAASQVGTTIVGAGLGAPIYVPQPGRAPTGVYLAGPYKGAPYSLVVKVPAEAGPFNLGTVAVRNALFVDPTTTQVTAESDPLPQILLGVPITYRDIRVEIDRPEFTVNPTNCAEQKETSVLTSVAGATASPTTRFQAAGCRELGFEPSLGLSLSGAVGRTGHPALSATLKAPAGQSNIAKTTVILPQSMFIDHAHVNGPCTRVQFNANACPKSSILGTAKAWSPLLDRPLEGPVYFRSNGGERELPDLVADLDGQIHVVLVGFIDSIKTGKETSRVRTRFTSVPDAPVSKFVLKMKGGKRGLLQNSKDLCKTKPVSKVQMTGQNTKTHDFEQRMGTSCGSGKKKSKK